MTDKKMTEKILCESDFRFMNVIWDNEGVNSMKLVRICAERLGWKKSTTFTMLRKMIGKGLVSNANGAVVSLISREQIQAKESGIFVDRTFTGSLPAFLAAFLGERKITDEEKAELKKLIDEAGK